MTRKTEEAQSRRDFLKLAATTTPIAAVAVATTGGTAERLGANDRQHDRSQRKRIQGLTRPTHQ